LAILLIAPSDPRRVGWQRELTHRQSSLSWGDGIYNSTDAGKTWKNMGLAETHHIVA